MSWKKCSNLLSKIVSLCPRHCQNDKNISIFFVKGKVGVRQLFILCAFGKTDGTRKEKGQGRETWVQMYPHVHTCLLEKKTKIKPHIFKATS